jgi:uncharacterized protein (TIGR00266 family)
MQTGMKVEILNQPNTAIAHIQLEINEEILAQAGSVMIMSDQLKINTMMQRGSEKVADNKKNNAKNTSNEQFLFLNSFKAKETEGEIYLAPPLIGEIFVHNMSKYKLIVRINAYLASSSKIEIFSGFDKFKSLFSNESNSWLSLVGDGPVLISAFGRVTEVDVDGEYIINLENIIAFENSLSFKLLPAKSIGFLSIFSHKESLCHFKGKGKVVCQTHRTKAFTQILRSEIS